MKRQSPDRTDDLQRTVKAYSFVAGKKIQNQTDIAKVSHPEEHSHPVKVLYVKPGMNKPSPLVRQNKDQNSNLKPLNTLKSKLEGVNCDQQLASDISLGDISGIFKAVKEKRVRSAP